MNARTLAFDVGRVAFVWTVLLAIENFVVGVAWRAEFVASWEMAHARRFLTPIALGAAFPLAMMVVIVARMAAARRARELGALAAAFAGIAAIGVSTGRHFASLPLRAAFVVVVSAIAGAIGAAIVRRVPIDRPMTLAAAGAGVAALAWLADAFVLPRLYPAFHLALLVVAVGAWAATALVLRAPRVRGVTSIAGLVFLALSLAWTSHAAAAVRRDDNLRRVLLEPAPLVGRAVVVAAHVAPPSPITDDEAAVTAASLEIGPAAHALEWRGHDLVLVTIDALRADHVSSYGYPRVTTPNIDRLAARGARFTHAYCPTPHTSYSVTSMMTGKYIRPLLAMGAGAGSDTWPAYLRHYGWRTAAFYPPAVFFIDEQRFEAFRDSGLGFEYRKVEFAKPELRRAQVERYLAQAPQDKPLFLWVHLFEPHEPYEMHPEHPFSGDETSDAYDSEIATADALTGDVVAAVEKRRPGAIVIVSADHGEELGDHGGRYHGTTVYEEQVRVPLVVVAPGVAPRVIEQPVQTIDLLPTTLAALDVPRPARVRGRDLGGLLAGRDAHDEGLAFAETDDWTMVARGADRLVCARKIGACTLYDVTKDPAEKHPVVDRPDRVAELRRVTAAIERENGRIEATQTPEALRRCLQGDRDAAEDVAPLLDDARVENRRAAARCAFGLRAPAIAPQLRRALEKDEDPQVKHWAAIALLALAPSETGGANPHDVEIVADEALGEREGEPAMRVAAAIAFASRGDARGEARLVARWDEAFVPVARGEVDEGRSLLSAMAHLRARSATPSLTRSLGDVRLRPYIVEALESIGDPRARAPLLAAFANERYVNLREPEARVLGSLGATTELEAPLARFAGVPEPMPEAIGIAHALGLLHAERGGAAFDGKSAQHASVRLARGGATRLLVQVADATREATLSAKVDGASVTMGRIGDGTVWAGELGERAAGPVALELDEPGGVLAAWVVPLAPEIPPPPPRAWDAGPETPFDAPSERGLESAP